MVSFYSYSSGSWKRVHDFPVATTYATGFAFGNYGYVAGVSHDCFKYDPSTDTWARLDASIGCVNCGRGIERGFAFVNNGYVYVGGGNSSSSTYFLYRTVGNAL
jgi:N-acetylneuraminic acid mutarotase